MTDCFLRWLIRRVILLSIGTGLVSCAGWQTLDGTEKKRNDNVASVAVRALNYTSRELAIIGVEEPGKPGGGAGGEALNPYGGGGTVCCFDVPAKWDPDFRLVVMYRFYPETQERRFTMHLPPYGENEVGSLWIMAHEDETAEAVVSRQDPKSPAWPGKVKGYPKPSREYRLKIWEREVKEAENAVLHFQNFLKDRTEDGFLKLWKFDQQYDKEVVKNFNGPNDPKYREHLNAVNKRGLEFFSAQLRHLLDNKP